MTVPDIVIPVRRGERNEELRYALRSLSFVPHGKVWIAGHMPSWVQNCGHIPTHQNGSKHQNSTKNLIKACQHDEVAEDFVLWSDDIFLLQKIEQVPVLHMGTLGDFIYRRTSMLGTSAYIRGVLATCEILCELGIEESLCYELHVPVSMTKSGMLEVFYAATAEGMPRTTALQVRSLFCNYFHVGGEPAIDSKVMYITDTWTPGLYLSSSDKIFGHHPVTKTMMQLFAEPGPYEARRGSD
jgi:hypothetical protein